MKLMTNISSISSIASLPADNYSRYLLEQINRIRIDPQSFIGVIEDAKVNIAKDRFGRIIYKGKIKVALNLGEAAFEEAINYLKEIRPMEPLIYKQIITVNAPMTEDEILDKNDLSKTSSVPVILVANKNRSLFSEDNPDNVEEKIENLKQKILNLSKNVVFLYHIRKYQPQNSH